MTESEERSHEEFVQQLSPAAAAAVSGEPKPQAPAASPRPPSMGQKATPRLATPPAAEKSPPSKQPSQTGGSAPQPQATGPQTAPTSPPPPQSAAGQQGHKKSESSFQPKDPAEAEKSAKVIEEVCVPAALFSVLESPDGAFTSPAGAKLYVDNFVCKSRKLNDPVEDVIVQQIVLMHHRLVRLHEQASHTKSPEATKILNGATARLTAELRRMVLALRTYRSPIVTKSVQFVKLQAVAEKQDVRYVDQKLNEKIVLTEGNELERNQPIGGRFASTEEPATRVGREAERLQTAGVDG